MELEAKVEELESSLANLKIEIKDLLVELKELAQLGQDPIRRRHPSELVSSTR